MILMKLISEALYYDGNMIFRSEHMNIYSDYSIYLFLFRTEGPIIISYVCYLIMENEHHARAHKVIFAIIFNIYFYRKCKI